tara:strand:- start:728 stop:931 length:204 start_codon:yes stop_codon:yes gene_type:complete
MTKSEKQSDKWENMSEPKQRDMKNKIEEICNKLNREQLSVYSATEELLILFNVSQQREPLQCFCNID